MTAGHKREKEQSGQREQGRERSENITRDWIVAFTCDSSLLSPLQGQNASVPHITPSWLKNLGTRVYSGDNGIVGELSLVFSSLVLNKHLICFIIQYLSLSFKIFVSIKISSHTHTHTNNTKFSFVLPNLESTRENPPVSRLWRHLVVTEENDQSFYGSYQENLAYDMIPRLCSTM